MSSRVPALLQRFLPSAPAAGAPAHRVLEKHSQTPLHDLALHASPLGAAQAALDAFGGLGASHPPHERRAVLRRLGAAIEEHAADLARLVTLETGKTIGEAQVEVARCASVVGECATRLGYFFFFFFFFFFLARCISFFFIKWRCGFHVAECRDWFLIDLLVFIFP
jgi:hypothetical protein